MTIAIIQVFKRPYFKSVMAFSFCFSFTELPLEHVIKAFHITTKYTQLYLQMKNYVKHNNEIYRLKRFCGKVNQNFRFKNKINKYKPNIQLSSKPQ
jgi:hypothetical protein